MYGVCIKRNGSRHPISVAEVKKKHVKVPCVVCKNIQKNHIIIIIGFLINVQVQGHHPHQRTPFQVTG